jgi:hypothetical protein
MGLALGFVRAHFICARKTDQTKITGGDKPLPPHLLYLVCLVCSVCSVYFVQIGLDGLEGAKRRAAGEKAAFYPKKV